MPKFHLTYTFEVACYARLILEAADAQSAQRLANLALEQGRFDDTHCKVDWDSSTNPRAQITGPAPDEATPDLEFDGLTLPPIPSAGLLTFAEAGLAADSQAALSQQGVTHIWREAEMDYAVCKVHPVPPVHPVP